MARIARASTIATLAALAAAFLPAQEALYGSAADIETFASALQDAKYTDLAKEVIQTALERGVQDPNGLLAYSLCEISATEAMRTQDPTVRITRLKEAVVAYESYLKKFPTGSRAAVARLKLSEWLRIGGESISAQIKKETDPAKKETLKNDGLNLFTKAEVLAKTRIDELARTPKAQLTEELQAELLALKFSVARMPFSKAMLYENRTGVEAQQLLNEAQTLLEEFDLDAPSGSILVFEARRLIALIAVERNDLKTAEDTLGYSCDQLADAVTANAAANETSIVKDTAENQEVRDLIARMFLEKAEFLTKTKKPADWKGALDTTEKLVKLIPDVVKTREGKQALIILAEALNEDGKTARARTVAQSVYDNDPSGDSGLKAQAMIEKLGTGGGTDVASMLKLLAGTVERGDIAQGERMAARILTSAEAREKPEVQADALLQLGGLYYNKGFYAYSAVVFAAVADEFPTSPRAPEAKFNEAMSHAKQSGLEKGQAATFWKNKSRTARTDLINRFGASKEAQDVSWFAAQDAELEEKFSDAVDLYLKVSSTSPKYGEAQHKAASLAFDLGTAARLRDKPDEVAKRFKTAEGALKNAATAFEAAAKNAINSNEVSRLKESIFGARLLLAGIYIQKELRKPDESLKLLDQVEADYKDDKGKVGRIWSLRIKTLSILGRGKEVVDILNKQLDVATPETLVNVAGALDQVAKDKLAANDKDPTVEDDLKTTAKFLSLAVDKAGGAGGQKLDWNAIGQKLLYLGARLSKIPADLSLLGLDPTVPLAEKATIEHARKALELAAPGEALDIDRQRAIAFAAAATGNWLDAVAALKEVADKFQLFTDKNALNKDVAQKYPRLPDVYQDLAVAYIRAAKGEKAHCDSAKEILIRLIRNSEPTSKRYWESRYLHLFALKEAKEYAELDSALDGLARTAPDADGNKFGMKAKIDEIRAFRDKKIVNK